MIPQDFVLNMQMAIDFYRDFMYEAIGKTLYDIEYVYSGIMSTALVFAVGRRPLDDIGKQPVILVRFHENYVVEMCDGYGWDKGINGKIVKINICEQNSNLKFRSIIHQNL